MQQEFARQTNMRNAQAVGAGAFRWSTTGNRTGNRRPTIQSKFRSNDSRFTTSKASNKLNKQDNKITRIN